MITLWVHHAKAVTSKTLGSISAYSREHNCLEMKFLDRSTALAAWETPRSLKLSPTRVPPFEPLEFTQGTKRQAGCASHDGGPGQQGEGSEAPRLHP